MIPHNKLLNTVLAKYAPRNGVWYRKDRLTHNISRFYKDLSNVRPLFYAGVSFSVGDGKKIASGNFSDWITRPFNRLSVSIREGHMQKRPY